MAVFKASVDFLHMKNPDAAFELCTKHAVCNKAIVPLSLKEQRKEKEEDEEERWDLEHLTWFLTCQAEVSCPWSKTFGFKIKKKYPIAPKRKVEILWVLEVRR